MKRRDIVHHLETAGWRFLREGSKHTVYYNENATAPAQMLIEVPRHRELKERMAEKILKQAGLQ
jgi:predicted RNA binding protein YcfA (HicA-like mRNA interferase family)